MLRFILFIFFLGVLLTGKSVTVTAVATGNWSGAGTWDLGVPGCYDTIVIPVGIVVTVTSTVNLNACPATYIWVKGELHFQTGKKLDLSCGSVVYMDAGPPSGSLTAGGGGGSSNFIKICGVTYWTAADGDITGPEIFCAGCFLPIELLYFKADPRIAAVDLTWATASEINNAYFIVQRSLNGLDWNNLSTIPGAGSSSSRIDYELKDFNYYSGLTYYRLIQVDFDGTATIYDPVSVNYESKDIRVFPNPIQSGAIITIQTTQDLNTMEIYTVVGARINSSQLLHLEDDHGFYKFRCDLPAGQYTLVINGVTTKLIVFN